MTKSVAIKRIKSLDGIRAVAILMVLLAHSANTLPAAVTQNSIFSFFSDGNKGVQIFFVLSGFLITKLLLIEKEKTGTINVKAFYWRRMFRIFPIFYLYIAVILVLKITVYPTIISNYFSIVIASLYAWNFHHLFEKFGWHESNNGLWYLGHFWTLSIEEQFYLIWPFLFKRLKAERLKKTVIILLFIFPLIRIMLYFFTPFKKVEGFMYDSILVGCLGAILENNSNIFHKIFQTFNRYLYPLISFLMLFIINPILDKYFRGYYGVSIGISLNNFIIMYLIFWTIYQQSVIQRILNWKVVSSIGIVSYSIYIWQQLIFKEDNNSKINIFPYNFLLVIAISFTSFYLFEKPIMGLREKLKKIIKIKILSRQRG